MVMIRMFADIHTHILPFMDDGAESYEEALEMLRMMESNGVTHVVATPHFSFDKNNQEKFIRNRTEVLKNLRIKVKEENINIAILGSAELMYSSSLHTKDLEDFVIEGTDYLLIELSTRRDHPSLEDTMYRIINMGYIPILAHAERYPYLINKSQRLIDLINMGVLIQVNASSLDDEENYPYIKAMMKNNLVHLTGSDAHSTNVRKPNLIKEDINPEYAINQNKVIRNELLDISKPKTIKKIFNKYF